MAGRSGAVFHAADARARVPGTNGEHYSGVLRRGTLDIKLSLGQFAPRPNQQEPHAQDEIYVVVSGRGVLQHGERRDRFEAGDLLFVPAGTDHSLQEFSDDLAVWVIFFGPVGGERP